MTPRANTFFWLWFLCLLPFVGHGQGLSASLDRETVTLGDNVTLTLNFVDGAPDVQPGLPDISGLRLIGTSSSQQYSLVNGRMSSSVSYQYTLATTRIGEIQIPAFSIRVGGKTLTSQPLNLRVGDAPPPPSDDQAISNQVAFVRLVLTKEEACLGEIIVAELQLYLSSAVRSIDNFQMQSVPADGFTVGQLVGGQKRQVRLANRIWTVVPLSLPVTTIKTGPLTLGPIQCSFIVNRDPFGFFTRGQQGSITVRSDAASVQCLPLPRENQPASFNGAVGSFDMTFSAGPTNVAVGDPITLRIQIAGSGQLDGLTLPAQKGWDEFKAYPPTSELQTSGQLGITGVKTFEQIMIPEKADITELPPFEFSFFDPEKKAYHTLKQSAIPLVVRAAGALPSPVIAAPTQVEKRDKPEQDIVHIKPRMGTLAQIGPPLIQRPGFIAAQVIPLAVWLSALLWRKRTDALANNPRLRRRREVDRLVHSGLQDLRRHARAGEVEAFFAQVFRLLQERIGERLDVPASSITESVIEEQLKPRQVPEETRVRLHELFQTCNFARYAPNASSQELNALVPKVEQTLKELEGVKG